MAGYIPGNNVASMTSAVFVKISMEPPSALDSTDA